MMAVAAAGALLAAAAHGAAVEIPAAFYRPPFQAPAARESVWIKAFRMDESAVTTREFLAFVRRHGEWAKSRVKPIFSDSLYLSSWRNDFTPPAKRMGDPVTEISWFAAKAYCADRGARLPMTDEWERAAIALPPGVDSASQAARILEWYASPASSASEYPARSGLRNAFGLRDLHGRIWEWTSDFNAAGLRLPGGANGKENTFFCGAAGQAAPGGADYAAFMRFSFRAALKPSYSVGSLGFRCVQGE
jgi:sulfatase modifying factor 1